MTYLLFAAETADKAALFDFDATLPVIALQFLLLVAVLKALYFEPVTKTIDGRNDYVRVNVAAAKDKLAQAEALEKQYRQETAQMRMKAQSIVTEAEAEANKIRNQQVLVAQQEAQAKVEAARTAIAQDKEAAIASLDQQAQQLSQQIMAKLLGAAANGQLG